MTDRELIRKALENLEDVFGENREDIEIVKELRNRLAQTEPGPVAWITKGGKGDLWWYRSVDENGNDNLDDVPLYMDPPQPVAKYSDIVSDGKLDPRNKFDAPPQRPWVGLTDNEADEVYKTAQEQINKYWESGGSTIMFPTMLYKAIEAKLKEKNKHET